jgi:hypothetical protein
VPENTIRIVRFILLWVVVVLGCGDGDSPPADAGHDAPALDASAGDAPIDAPEDAGPCIGEGDGDGDGQLSRACGGNDCDDTDPDRYPGNAEVCDASDLDEDCDPTTYGLRDADGDGRYDASCCNVDGTSRRCGDDCDDSRGSAHPAAPEVCDGADNDCDTLTDEGVLLTMYRDMDGDSFGVLSMPMEACGLPAAGGWAFDFGDCDDARPGVNPSAAESCVPGGRDDDCDGAIDEGCDCTFTDPIPCGEPAPGGGILTEGACEAGTQACIAGTLAGCVGAVRPTLEVCSLPTMEDEDCDGSTDEGGLVLSCYVDADGDGFTIAGAVGAPQCECGASETTRPPSAGIDCAPTDPAIYPGAAEPCDGVDANCDGQIEDADGDGHVSPSTACTGGPLPKDDCNDAQEAIHPGQTCFRQEPVCLSPANMPCIRTVGARRVVTCGIRTSDGRCDDTMPTCEGPGCKTWDYDCSGSDERAPIFGGTCTQTPPIGWSCATPPICHIGPTCLDGDGVPIHVSGAPDRDPGTCGLLVDWSECTFECTTGCGVPSSRPAEQQPFPCR